MIPFERYDEEFASLTNQVTSKLRALDDINNMIDIESSSSSSNNGKSSNTNNNEADVRMAHALLCQADDLLKQMGLEARGVEDASMKRDLLGKVRFYFVEKGVTVCVFFFLTHLLTYTNIYTTLQRCVYVRHVLLIYVMIMNVPNQIWNGPILVSLPITV